MASNPLIDLDIADAGIDDAAIALLVRTFYARARADDLIGPIFAAAVMDWDEHIAKITDFWSGIMLRTSRYDGRPLRPHIMLGIESRHFDRWLDLFEATARELFAEKASAAFILRARRIADSFEMAIGTQRGEVRSARHVTRTAAR